MENRQQKSTFRRGTDGIRIINDEFNSLFNDNTTSGDESNHYTNNNINLLDNIPQSMKNSDSWLLMGKDNCPVNENGQPISFTKSKAYKLNELKAMYPSHKNGFGYRLNSDCVIFDFDKCIDSDGKMYPWAKEYLNPFLQDKEVYIELSRSKSGLHVIYRMSEELQNQIKTSNKSCPSIKIKEFFTNEKSHTKSGIDILTKRHMITVTGDVIKDRTIKELKKCDEKAINLYNKIIRLIDDKKQQEQQEQQAKQELQKKVVRTNIELNNKQDIFDEIKNKASLELLMGYRGLEYSLVKNISCPFHEDKKPSFRVYPTNSYKCFSCGSAGTIIDFVMKQDNLSPLEACFKIDEELGLNLKIDKQSKKTLTIQEKVRFISDLNVKAVIKQGAKLPENTTSLPYILEEVNENTGKVKTNINLGELAIFLRQNTHYIFLRADAKDGVQRFIYSGGYYKLSSDNDFKNLIKKYIPESILKMHYVVEVMNNLYTDDVYYSYSQLNPEKYINFKDGLLNIKTWELEKHTHEVLTTIQLPLEYPRGDKLPATKYFDNYINYLVDGDNEKKQLIFEFMGVALSNIHGYRMKKALFMVGKHDTGKSKIKELMIKLLGQENTNTLDLETLEARFGSSNIFNKRLIGSNDMSFLKVKELKIFKLLTGGDTMFMEKKGENGFNAQFLGVSWFCCNELPAFGGDKGDGVYKRFAIIQCNDTPIPENKQDTNLVNHMLQEKEYIVNTALTALKQLISNNYKYSMPQESTKAIEKYKIDNDSFLTFFDTCTEARPNAKLEDKCHKSKVYKIYAEWCKDNNNNYKITKRDMQNKLKELKKDKEKCKNGYTYYTDFTLTYETKTEYQDIYGTIEYQETEREGIKKE